MRERRVCIRSSFAFAPFFVSEFGSLVLCLAVLVSSVSSVCLDCQKPDGDVRHWNYATLYGERPEDDCTLSIDHLLLQACVKTDRSQLTDFLTSSHTNSAFPSKAVKSPERRLS